MQRIINNKMSRYQLGHFKMLDKQTAKPREVKRDFGMNTIIIHKNKMAHECEGLMQMGYLYKWQPLRYCIRKIAHTTYTYGISKIDTLHLRNKRRKLRRAKTT